MKRITLDRNSWHFKYYCWVLNTKTPPATLCPYFWTMICLIAIAPIILFFAGIYFLFNKVVNIYNYLGEKLDDLINKRNKNKVSKGELSPEEILDYNLRDLDRRKRKHQIGKYIVKFLIIAGKTIFFSFIILAIGIGIYQFYKSDKKIEGLIFAFIMIVIVVVIYFTILGIIKLSDNYKKRKRIRRYNSSEDVYSEAYPHKETAFTKFVSKIFRKIGYGINLTWTMIVATYRKACPIITWTGEEPTPINEGVHGISTYEN